MSMQAGGAAMQGGARYQNQVAAYLSTIVLAEKAASLPFEYPSDITLEFVSSETAMPMDDVLAITSNNGGIYIQAKTSISASINENSEFSKTIGQFVNQYLTQRDIGEGGQAPWERPLDYNLDRIVLATSQSSSNTIKTTLPNLLIKIRNKPAVDGFNDLELTQNEAQVFSKVINHLNRAWMDKVGIEPTEEEAIELLRLVWIAVWHFENDNQESVAKVRLSSSVLKDPSQADGAWSLLIETCSQHATDRTGADRKGFQNILLDGGYDLQAVISYRDDINRLAYITTQNLASLSRFEQIQVGGTFLSVSRSVSEVLFNEVIEGSLAITGLAGIGKSGVLVGLARRIHEEGKDVILIKAQDLLNSSVLQVQSAMGLSHSLPEILMNWPGRKPAFLIIDALDALRATHDQQALADLVELAEKTERWKVVASIRTYDLTHSRYFKGCFRGNPVADINYINPNIGDIRHIQINPFTSQELSFLTDQYHELLQLYTQAGEHLKELIRIPFNLNLASELIQTGHDPTELSTIASQIQLLDRYWDHRINVTPQQSWDFEVTLKFVVEKMIEERQLQIEKAVLLASPNMSQSVPSLTSNNILSESESLTQEMIQFSHHLLFDYAVHKLYLRNNTFRQDVIESPDLAIFLRPSLDLLYQSLWYRSNDRKGFWDYSISFADEQDMPEIAKIIGPNQAVALAENVEDFSQLLLKIDDETKTANAVLQYLIAALLSNPKVHIQTSDQINFWVKVAERVSNKAFSEVAFSLLRLLRELKSIADKLNHRPCNEWGLTARKIMNWTWENFSQNKIFMRMAISQMCFTFATEPSESNELLSRFLNPDRLSDHAHEDLSPLTDGLKYILEYDSELVKQVYITAFSHKITENSQTSILESRIGPTLTSNARQDFRMVLYRLSKFFPEFLIQQPTKAADSMINAWQSFIDSKRRRKREALQEHSFHFLGNEAIIRQDGSSRWDWKGSGSNEVNELLNAFDSRMEQLAENGDYNEIISLLKEIVIKNRSAGPWGRLLILGTKKPQKIGLLVKELSWTIPILIGYDTYDLAGEFLKKIYPLLEKEEKEKVERVILSTPDALGYEKAGKRDRELFLNHRNRLLGCLQQEELVTKEAEEIISELMKNGGPPVNRVREAPKVTSRGLTPMEYLGLGGIQDRYSVEDGLENLLVEIEQFNSPHYNQVASNTDIEEVWPNILRLKTKLFSDSPEMNIPEVQKVSWRVLSKASEIIIRSSEENDSEKVEVCRDVLCDSRTDESSAARGLMFILGKDESTLRAVLDRITALAKCSEKYARFEVANNLRLLIGYDPELMWSLAEDFSQKEEEEEVLDALIQGSLFPLARDNTERVFNLLSRILQKIGGGANEGPCLETCIELLLFLSVWMDHEKAGKELDIIVENPLQFVNAIIPLTDILCGHMDNLWKTRESPPIKNKIVFRLNGISEKVANQAIEMKHALGDKPEHEISPNKRDQISQIYNAANNIALRLFYASGIHDNRGNGPFSFSNQKSKLILDDIKSIAEMLLPLGHPSIAHHFIQILDSISNADPVGVFDLFSRLVLAAAEGGYPYESMAMDQVVEVVEHYLSEYRDVIIVKAHVRTQLSDILDLFIRAGWPEATTLIYRLDEIYR